MSDQLNISENISLNAAITPLFGKGPKKIKPKSKLVYGPIETKMRSKLESLKGCKYPDQFNWGVYDEIASRYGDKQPRGGVVFQTTFKLVNYHTSCSKCHYALELDSYGRGCVHNCAFCYSKDQLSAHGFWNRPMPFPVDLSEIRKILYKVFETDKPSKWRPILGKRIPVRIGSMSDSFMWMDYKYKVTQELIRILNYYRYPHIIFTRSDLAAHDDYISIYDKDLISIQFSISGGNDKITKLVEPGAPSAEKRLKALSKLNELGFWTTVRLNPFFPMHPDGYFSDEKSIRERFGTKENAPQFNWFEWDLLDRIKATGTPSVLAGVVRLSSHAISEMSKATGMDLKSFFKPEYLSMRGDKHYSDSEIAYYYSKLRDRSHKLGLRFNTCYIGNGEKDYYQYQTLWDNKKDCCDVIGNVAGFKTTSQVVPWSVREKHAQNKDIVAQSKRSEEEMQLRFPGLKSTESQPTI